MESGSLRPRDQLLHELLALALDDRAFLADELERSLPAAVFTDDEIAAAWSKEIDRRVAAYDRGETTGVSFEASLARLRQSLQARRSQASS